MEGKNWLKGYWQCNMISNYAIYILWLIYHIKQEKIFGPSELQIAMALAPSFLALWELGFQGRMAWH